MDISDCNDDCSRAMEDNLMTSVKVKAIIRRRISKVKDFKAGALSSM